MAESIQVVHLDDEPDFAQLVAANLERENERLTVQAATSVTDGLDQVGDHTDCIISDYQLGDGTGLDVLEAARTEIPNIPVILFTDTGSEEVASRAISADVTDYMIKGVAAEQYGLLANKIVTAVDQRRTAQRATQVEQHLHELSEQANDVLYIFEGDWNDVLFINSAYETVFEQPVEMVKDNPTTFVQAIHPADRERVMLAMERVTDGQFIQVDYRIDTAGPTEKWVESQAKPVIVNGAVTRIVGYTRDISERKTQMQELKRKNAQLDRFSSVVAHDLRNPWNVAHGYLEIARSETDSQELEKVSISLTRMDEIITNLLELAKIGATVDDLESISVQDLTETCWNSIAEPEATLNVAADVTIEGNAMRLAQLFENLFRNAIDHGEADVTITVGLLEDGSGFFVQDDGPGIPPSEHQTVLEWGVTTSNTGTGFGLAIVQEIVDAHGWELQITTQPAGGARFEFTEVEFAA